MSPSRRHPYRAPRPRREVITAVAACTAVILFTVIVVWVLAPHTSSSGSTPATTAPAASAPIPTSPAATTAPATTPTTAAPATTSSTAGK